MKAKLCLIFCIAVFCCTGFFSCKQVDVNANSKVHVITISDDSYHGQQNPLNGPNNDAYGFIKSIAKLQPDAHVHAFMSSYTKSFVLDYQAEKFPDFDQMTYPTSYLSSSGFYYNGEAYVIAYENAGTSTITFYSHLVLNAYNQWIYDPAASDLYLFKLSNKIWYKVSKTKLNGTFYNKNVPIAGGVPDGSAYCPEYNSSNNKGSTKLSLDKFFNFIPPNYGSTGNEVKITQSSVLSYIASLAPQLDENSLVLLFISTHGGSDGSICIGEKDVGGTDSWKNGLISMSLVLDELNKLQGTKVIFQDTCYSGLLLKDSQYLSSTSVFVDKALSKESLGYAIGNSSFVYSPVNDFNNVWVMAATTADTLSRDGLNFSDYQAKFGAFTGYVLYYLGYDMTANEATGAKCGSKITLHNMFDFIWKNFPNELKAYKKSPQIPQVYLSPIDVVLFGPVN